MINNNLFYSSLLVKPPQNNWLIEFLAALPELLTSLIGIQSSQSLERLQLVSFLIDLKRESPKDDLTWTEISQLQEGDLLKLTGVLKSKNQIFLRCEIQYFVRGARLVFTPPIDTALKSNGLEVTITENNISDFFRSLNQFNESFLSLELARLNGLKTLPIPSQMLLAFILSHAEKTCGLYHTYSLSFLKVGRPNEPLILNLNKDTGAVFQNGEQLIYLKAH